jgi:hypothetical protein
MTVTGNYLCFILSWFIVLVYISPFAVASRLLSPGDFDEFNAIVEDAEIQLPDSLGSSTLKLYNIRCTDFSIGDTNLWSRQQDSRTVQLGVEVTDLDMFCIARYDYSGWLLNGRGDVEVTSRGNDVSVEGLAQSSNFDRVPPTGIEISTCNPTVNINDIDFNGGILGVILNTVERLLRDIMERLIRNQLCSELEQGILSAEGFLDFAKETLDEYNDDADSSSLDPIEVENSLQVPSSVNLLNLQDQESQFGQWVDEALDHVVSYLRTVVSDRNTGETNLKANLLIREHLLEDGALLIEIADLPVDGILYQGHDVVTETTIRLDSVKLVGLDTLIQFDPMATIGRYTLQNRLGWEHLAFELEATIEIKPSSLEDSIIESPSNARILEQVQVILGIDDLLADVSLLSAINQDLLESLQLGSLLQKENALPCLFSTIFRMEVSSFSVQANDIQTPRLDGFVSNGLDRVFSEVMDAAFLLYEKILLDRSPAFFQKDIRPLLNERFLEKYIQDTSCAPFNWEANAMVDFRDLLLPPLDALLAGGTGKEPYGNMFSSFVTPNLKEQVMQVDKLNEQYIRPITKEQSGIEGTLAFESTLFEYKDLEPSALYDKMEFRVSNVRIHNLDTVTGPLNLLDPRDWNILFNTITLDSDGLSQALNVTASVLLSIGGKDSPLRMKNQVDFSISTPSTTVSLGILASMRESSLLNFPLNDVTNAYCWLAALGSWGSDLSIAKADQRSSSVKDLDLSSLSFFIPSFKLDSSCVSCSSPGADFLSQILDEFDQFGLGFHFKERLVNLVEEMMWAYWNDFDADQWLSDAPKFCPHYPEYDPDADTSNQNWPQISKLSIDSFETILAIGIVALQTSLVVSAKNHLLNEEATAGVIYYQVPQYPEDAQIVDWTNLSADMGDWAAFGFEDFRKYLEEPIRGNTKRNAGVTFRANILLRDFILDDEGVFTTDLENVTFEASGFQVAFTRVRVHGLDSISSLEVLIPTGPQRLENRFQIDNLKLEFDVGVTLDGRSEQLQVSYMARDISAQFDLLASVDLNKLREIRLGSIFDMKQIFSCVVSGVQDLRFARLSLSAGTLENPEVSGFFSVEYRESIEWVLESMLDPYREDVLAALPIVFDTTIRNVVNALLPDFVQSTSRQCPSPPEYLEDSLVDFRDLLLSVPSSRSLGGSGRSPYGDLFRTLYDMLNTNVLRTGASNRPLLNDLFRTFTERQSNVTGALSFPGKVLDSQTAIKVAGLEADIGFMLSAVSLEQIDSIGDPLELFQPISEEANLLDNTVSFGVDSKPLTMTGKVLLSFADGGKFAQQTFLDNGTSQT